jgi:hypothetical protein
MAACIVAIAQDSKTSLRERLEEKRNDELQKRDQSHRQSRQVLRYGGEMSTTGHIRHRQKHGTELHSLLRVSCIAFRHTSDHRIAVSGQLNLSVPSQWASTRAGRTFIRRMIRCLCPRVSRDFRQPLNRASCAD